MRAGKLFPGPHLYAGMAITGLWAAAAALVCCFCLSEEKMGKILLILLEFQDIIIIFTMCYGRFLQCKKAMSRLELLT
jgi:hypothetical protein